MSWFTPLTDSPYNDSFVGELMQPSIAAARIAHQWQNRGPNVRYGDMPQSFAQQYLQTPAQPITQNAFHTMYVPDGTKTNNHNFVQSSRLLADQAMFAKLMGQNLLGAP